MKDVIKLLSRSFSDHHLRYGEWLNLEFSKRENIQDGPLNYGLAIKTPRTDSVLTGSSESE